MRLASRACHQPAPLENHGVAADMAVADLAALAGWYGCCGNPAERRVTADKKTEVRAIHSFSTT